MQRHRIVLGWVIASAAGCSASFSAPDNFSEQESSSGDSDEPKCGESVDSMVECIEQERYVTDLTFIAAERPPGDAHWQAVQDLCFDRFTQLGYEVELHQYGTGINVIGTKRGLEVPDQAVVISAHYDHIPGCAGADDNATGVAGVLEVARVIAESDFQRTAIVACWDQEELGLVGSRTWVQRANADRQDLVANFNFEMIGYTDDAPGTQMIPAGFEALFPEGVAELEASGFAGNFITVVADELATEQAKIIERYADQIGLPLVRLELSGELKNSPLLADLRRSDHAPFWELNYPAMMLTDTSNFRYAAYHCGEGEDTVDMLDHEFSTQVLRASTGAIGETLGFLGLSEE